MPVYYKKVQRNSSDAVRFIDKRNRFSFGGVRNKLATRDSSADAEFSSIGDANFPLISYSKFERTLGSREELVETSYGTIVVAHQGAERTEKKPVIVTYHDIGMNHSLNFEGYFELAENKLLLQSFAVLHISAPGQERHANRLPDEYEYPTMEQLSGQVKEVLDHFNIKSCIGFGAGAGAHILIRLAFNYPELVDGLFLISPAVGPATWSEWFYHKKNIRSLQNNNRSSLLPPAVQEYLMWHHFGPPSDEREDTAPEIMELFKGFYKGIALNPYNLSLFIESYLKRTDLKLSRDKKDRQIKCQTVVMCGSLSPSVDETVLTNSKLDPKKATWIKLDGCGMVLEEKPYKVAQAFRLFLQGLGHTLKAYERRRALMSGASLPCLSSHADAGVPSTSRRMTLFQP